MRCIVRNRVFAKALWFVTSLIGEISTAFSPLELMPVGIGADKYQVLLLLRALPRPDCGRNVALRN